MVRFTIITAFPEFFRDFLTTSIVGRGVKAGLLEVDVVDLRSFGKGAYRQIDDYAFGGGGMVLMPEPLEEALNSIQTGFVVYPTPQGPLLTQEIVETLFRQPHVVIVCGHYEGVDERFVERRVDLEVTIGDCVLTGGEIPAMAIIDAVARLVPGVVGKENAVAEDSFYRGMLDHPHYTRPASWMGKNAPEVLLSGNAAAILEWRRKQAVVRTVSRRPELLSRSSLRGYAGGGFYISFEYVRGAFGYSAERLKELAGLCEAYGAARLLLAVKSQEDREELRRALETEDFQGLKIKFVPSWNRALDWVKEKEKTAKCLVVDVCGEAREGGRHWLEVKRLILENGEPAIFRFLGQGDRESEESAGCCVLPMFPIEGGKLSFWGEAAVVLDRFLGSK